MVPMRREDERSLWLNYALAAKLVADPDGVIERAKKRLQRLRSIHRHSGRWFDLWEDALNDGPPAVLAIMTDRSDLGQVMRSSSPIIGIGLLGEEERMQVLNAFRAYWNAAHPRNVGVNRDGTTYTVDS